MLSFCSGRWRYAQDSGDSSQRVDGAPRYETKHCDRIEMHITLLEPTKHIEKLEDMKSVDCDEECERRVSPTWTIRAMDSP